jgi:pteridine reductase
MDLATGTPLALVTGASRRLGKDLALALAKRGYCVVVHYLVSEKDAQSTAEEIQKLQVPVYIHKADLTDPNQINRLFQWMDTLDLPLKVLVNSAAVMPGVKLDALKPESFGTTMDLNLQAPLLCSQAASSRMKSGGLIVNISDVGAQKDWTGYPAYVVSKAAIEKLTRILAKAYAPAIRVNGIAPGLVYRNEALPQDVWDALVQKIPARRPAKPEEIASALEFLLSNEYITGQTIVVDGGYSLI